MNLAWIYRLVSQEDKDRGELYIIAVSCFVTRVECLK